MRSGVVEPVHGSQAGFQPSMIGFDRVVSVLLGDMTGSGHQLVEHPRVGGRVISGDLNRRRPVLQGAGEELASGLWVLNRSSAMWRPADIRGSVHRAGRSLEGDGRVMMRP